MPVRITQFTRHTATDVAINNVCNNQKFFVFIFISVETRVVCVYAFCRLSTAVNDIRFVLRVRLACAIIFKYGPARQTEKMSIVFYQTEPNLRALNATFYWNLTRTDIQIVVWSD